MRTWNELLNTLQSELDEVVTDYVERVKKIPPYDSDIVDDEDLRLVAHESLGLVVRALSDPEQYELVERYAGELGEKRASQGIPAEALTTAVRLNFPVLWSKLIELADEQYLPELTRHAESLWLVLDNYAVACYSSFHNTKLREAQHEASLKKEYVRALFTPEGKTSSVQTRFVQVFGAPVGVPYALFAMNGRPTDLLRQVERLHAHFLFETDTHTMLFWPFDPVTASDDYDLPAQLKQVPSALVPSFEGLGGLHEAAEQAMLLTDQLTPQDAAPLIMERDWPRITRNLLAAQDIDFGDELERALSVTRPGETERIKETVCAYLESGNIALTAERLFAHRNTVLNRLRRFEELTSIDLRVPAEAAKAVIAWLR